MTVRRLVLQVAAMMLGCTILLIDADRSEQTADVDECALSNGNCSHICTNTDGSYSCSCDIGYILRPDQHNCMDLDECAVAKGGCVQSCNNTVGSYFCDCEPGYVLEADQRNCVDIDECRLNEHNCQQNCENVVGFYKCSCFPGSQLESDGRTCSHAKLCSDPTIHCEHSCLDVPGSYVCACQLGHSLADDKVSCTDNNECSENNGGCSHLCINSVGSFQCSCFDGFIISTDSACSDIDECAKGTSGCEQNCSNTLGSYYCSCMYGYILLSDHHSCLKFKQGQTKLSPNGSSEGYVSMQLDAEGDAGQLQPFSICETREDGIKEKEATVICRSMNFASGSVASDPGKLDSKAMANHLMFGRDLDCDGDEEDVFQCSVDLMLTNCTTERYPAVSCYEDKDMLQRLRVGSRLSPFMIPEIFLNNSWQPVFFQDVQAASVGCRMVGYDTFLYSGSTTPSAGKIGLSCSSPDFSTIDECDFVTATQQPAHKCLFNDQVLFEIYPPGHGFGDLGQCINREAEENVTLEIWSCASVSLRLFRPQQRLEKFYEIRFDPFDVQKHSRNPHVSLWECSGSCAMKANSSDGRSFTCESPYDTRSRVPTLVTLEFSATSLGISTSLQGYTRAETLPGWTRRILWSVTEELSQMPCLAVGNGKHEMIVKVFRKKGLNRCLYNMAVDVMAQCGDSFIDQTMCANSGCCWLNNKCYIPRYSRYLGSYDGTSAEWRNSFRLSPVDLSLAEHPMQTIQMCLDACRNDSFEHAALNELHCHCGNGSLATLSKSLESTTESYALFETFYKEHTKTLRPLRENLGEVTVMTNSPQMVNVYAEVMLLISNFPQDKVTIDVSAGGEGNSFTAWQGPRVVASWVQPDQLQSYCPDQRSFCSLILRHPYDKSGNYTVVVKLRGLIPVETFEVSAVFSVLRRETLTEVLGDVVFVNSGPSYPRRSVQFLLALEKVSPDLQVRTYFADNSAGVVQAKAPNATLPSWLSDNRIVASLDKYHVLQFSHVFDEEGDFVVNASLTDSMWDVSNDSIVVSTTVRIHSFLKLFGDFFIMNDGPALRGYNVTFVLMAQSLIPQVTIRFDPGTGDVPYSVFLKENAELPNFVVERIRQVGIPMGELKSYPSFTSQQSYSKSGTYLAEVVLSDKARIHSVVKILSLKTFIGRVNLFSNSPVLVNRKVVFVICLNAISPRMQIDIDFGDKISTVLKESVDRKTVLPTWALDVFLSKSLERIEDVYKAVFEHTYATSAMYKVQITIWDKILDDKTDSVEVSTDVEVQSLANFFGQTLFSSSSPSNLEQNATFNICFEKFAEDISTVVDPKDGTTAKSVAIQKARESESSQFSSCAYVGTAFHAYRAVGQYRALARISDYATPSGDVVTITTTVVVECQVTMKLEVGNYAEKQQTYVIDRGAFAEFFVKTSSDCPTLPAEYQWYVLSTMSRIELDPSKGEEVKLPGNVNVESAVLSIPPNVLTHQYYVVAAEVRIWSGNWTFNWIDSVIIEMRGKNVSGVDGEDSGPAVVDAREDTPVKEVDVLSNVTLDGNAIINSTAYHNDATAYRWFCTRVGESIPTDALTHTGPSIGGCFGHGVSLGSTARIEFSALALLHSALPEDYTFHLYLSIPSYTSLMRCSMVLRLVMLTTHDVPRVTIFCKINCESQIRSEQELVLVAYCLNCMATESLGYVWDVLPTNSNCTIQYFDWKRNSVTGDGESYIIVNPNVFITNRDEVYEVTVTVIRLLSKLSGSASVFISPVPIK